MTALTFPKCRNSKDPILMVDDSELDFQIVKRFYEMSELVNPLVWCPSGVELLEWLERSKVGEKQVPALVFLDINMPEIDGFETLEKVRAQHEFEEVPMVIMLTNSDSPKDVATAERLGANGFQQKQYRLDSFLSFLNALAAQD